MHHLKKLATALPFLIPFTLYLLTIYPTVGPEDSGEFTTAAYHLGIAHPPGYPLYSLLGKFFIEAIPFGNIAWRVNVMSAFFTALSGMILFILTKKIATPHFKKPLHQNLLSIIILALYTTAPMIWSHAIRAEVYALNSFFILLIGLLLYLWHQNPNHKKHLLLIGFLFGLGTGNHHTLLLFIPAVAFFILFTDRTFFKKWPTILKGSLLFFLGLTIYAYLPIRSFANPPLDWGNPETWQEIWSVITRADFTTNSFSAEATPTTSSASSSPSFLPSLHIIGAFPLFMLHLTTSSFYLFPFFALISLALLFKKTSRTTHSFLLFPLTGFIIYATIISRFIQLKDTPLNEPFYIPLFLTFLLLIAYGIIYLCSFLKKQHKYPLLFVLVVISLTPLALNWSTHNQSNNHLFYDIARATLESTPKDSILYLSQSDLIFPATYLQAVENIRPDLTIYDSPKNKYPFFENWTSFSDIKENTSKRIFTDFPSETSKEFFYSHNQPFVSEMVPQENFSTQVTTKLQAQVIPELEKYPVRNAFTLDWRSKYLLANYELMKGLRHSHLNIGKMDEHFQAALKTNPQAFRTSYLTAHLYSVENYPRKASYYMEKALRLSPSPLLYNYTISLHQRARNPEKAASLLKEFKQKHPEYFKTQ